VGKEWGPGERIIKASCLETDSHGPIGEVQKAKGVVKVRSSRSLDLSNRGGSWGGLKKTEKGPSQNLASGSRCLLMTGRQVERAG